MDYSILELRTSVMRFIKYRSNGNTGYPSRLSILYIKKPYIFEVKSNSSSSIKSIAYSYIKSINTLLPFCVYYTLAEYEMLTNFSKACLIPVRLNISFGFLLHKKLRPEIKAIRISTWVGILDLLPKGIREWMPVRYVILAA